jgi:predicted nucleic acid-binding protein
MKIVVDTNRIIAALIKNGASRKILFETRIEFISPDHTTVEIHKYKEEIIRKAKITNEEFEILLSLIFDRIDIISKEEYKPHLKEAENLIVDMGDVPFIALALALKVDGIWSDDPHFLGQNKIRIFKTKGMLDLTDSPA